MSIVKSHSVGYGDMFYIKHGSDNFTIIDCFLDDTNKKGIVDEIITESASKGITRFISTHPDEDHICGLTYLNSRKEILNFYCVKNETSKDDESEDFQTYCSLRDSDKAFYIQKGCSRRWMNESNDDRGSPGINILWPDINNPDYKYALQYAKDGGSPNNISTVIKYSLQNGASFLWMGDLETEFMESVKDDLVLPKINILFAPHHGRDSGKIPNEMLESMNPDIIIIGEAPSEQLNYYSGYNTICQNDAEDIIFDCVTNKVHIYTSNEDHSVHFLDNEHMTDFDYYIGTLNI